MTVLIDYNNKSKKTSNNLVLFVGENFNISGIEKYLSNLEYSYISDLLKNSDLKKDLLYFEINSRKKIFLVSIKKDLKISEIENLGAKFHKYLDYDSKNDYLINSDSIKSKNDSNASIGCRISLTSRPNSSANSRSYIMDTRIIQYNSRKW